MGSNIMKASVDESIIWPASSFPTVERIILALSSGPKSRGDLVKIVKVSKGTLHSALPMMRGLKIIQSEIYKKSNFALTEEGERLANALQHGKEEEIRAIGERLISNSKALVSAKLRLTANPQIDSETLGQALGKEFGASWKHPQTYRNMGQHSKSLLSSLGIITRIDDRPPRGTYSVPNTRRLIPSASAIKIVETISLLSREDAKPIVGQLDRDSTKTYMLGTFKSVIDLGLVESPNGDKCFRLTEKGEVLKRALHSGQESRRFAEIINDYLPAKEVAEILSRIDHSVDATEIGNHIAHYNNSTWAQEASRQYGQRFLSWLKAAGMAQQNHEPNRYRVMPLAHIITDSFSSKEQSMIEPKEKSEPIETKSSEPKYVKKPIVATVESSGLVNALDSYLIETSEMLHSKSATNEIELLKVEIINEVKSIAEITKKEDGQKWLGNHLCDLTVMAMEKGDQELLATAVAFVHAWKKDLRQRRKM